MVKRQPIVFEEEVGHRFRFLVDRFGMTGPEYDAVLLPTVVYRGAQLNISAFLEQGDGAGTRIEVHASLLHRDWPSSAELSALVEAAAFAPRHRVAWKAHTPDAARATLDDNAVWLRRLTPLLLGPDPDTLVRTANEHKVDRAGNPLKRPRNIKWKYG